MDDTRARILVQALGDHQARARRSLNLTPSENTMSPLARLPLALDVYSRYFFDHMRLFGSWSFYGALEPGRIEQEVLAPLLQESALADHVDTRPISGLNCMTVAMAALCPPGGTMYVLPVAGGGHMSTASVAARLGIRTLPLPMRGHHDLDLDRLETLLKSDPPDLVYVDQSTQLFPLDPKPVRDLVDRHAPAAVIHYDSSHTNGLILGGALANPLERGAHTFGGSTHKTLPGPHKGFLATDDPRLAERIGAMAGDFVSHHHLGEVVSLAVTLVELKECGGALYARAVIDNARILAQDLHRRGLEVAASDRGFTDCHQVWVRARADTDPDRAADRMREQGLLVNKISSLPGLDGTAFRLSVAELTRLGAGAEHMGVLAAALDPLLSGSPQDVTAEVAGLRSELSTPRYCHSSAEVAAMGAPPEMVDLMHAIESANAADRR